jgi:molybdenum cofactor biosynthesis protein B
MGVNDHEAKAAAIGPLTAGLITVSDTRTPATDGSGDRIAARLETAGHLVALRALVPDTPSEIRGAILAAAANDAVDVIVLTGGTGATRRDTTVDTLRALPGIELEGFGELFRMQSFASIGAPAMLSRACAIVFEPAPDRRIPIFALPGSIDAVETAMAELIEPVLAHLVWQCRR